MMERSSTDLPEPEPPTTPSTSLCKHVQIDVLVQNASTDPRQQSLDTDDCGRCGRGAHIPSHEKVIEKAASATMTRKIDSTTACVVCRPTLEALRSTWKPWWQPTSAMIKAKTGALIRPTQNVQPDDRVT